MTLLGSEHSLLIRSKFRSVLQLRLQQRRTQEQLANQGIIPPLKRPAEFHEQRKHLDSDKAKNSLKRKARNRCNSADLVNMHILQASTAERSIPTAQMKLKRARLADDLNEKIALRPGPLELVEKNILPVDSAVKEAIKGNQVSFSKSTDAFAFEEDSSSDGLSPDQTRSEDPQNSAGSPPDAKASDTPSTGSLGTNQDLASGSENDRNDSASQPSHQSDAGKQGLGPPSTPIAVHAAVKSKSLGDSKNRHKKPKDPKPKVKKLKYHQYIPPDQKAEKSPPPMDSAYARLLQQQQLFLQLQILSQQQQQQQHRFSYLGMHQAQLKEPNEQMVRNPNSSSTPLSNTPLSPVKNSFSGQTGVSSFKPGPLPPNLDDLKVSELRQQLRIRGLPVSGTKTALMDRLRPFQDCSGNPVPNFGDITTVTFPVTPNTLPNYQSSSSTSALSNGFYHFGSTSSSPPISPASSDLSVAGSLPDTFNDASPSFGLHPSPVHVCTEESLMSSLNGGSVPSELDGLDSEKDKMLVEKQKVINELTWKLQQEQRQVEELRMQLQKQKRNNCSEKKPLPFLAASIKQEEAVSSCPFASQVPVKRQSSSSECHPPACEAAQLQPLGNAHCVESSDQTNVLSSTFLSPQCSPQHSPLGAVKSPQHISLPPSPNNPHFLPSSSGAQGEGHRVSSPISSQVCTAQMAGLHSSDKVGPKFSIPSPTFSKSSSAISEVTQPPSYEDAVKQQMTRSQQMDELLDVLIESGEMPADAREDHSCLQKVPKIPRSSRSPTAVLTKPSASFEQASSGSQIPFDPYATDSDEHLEVLLNSQSPLGKMSDVTLLKIGSEEPHFDGIMDGFSGKAAEDLFNAHEILPGPLSPMQTQFSPSSVDSNGLQLSFTESPWETMEWLDLTPPNSTPGFSALTTSSPSIFNIDFLDVTDLNLNSSMDLHLQQW
ncbi:myocardin [Homo sapiens]|uniref:Myocardin n=1 Tax=Homo sapiens TaxID=9606 RepID=MYCD_HUMAN|nr:myocardin isoform 2 [Homo sapiens]Q8IZQ8.1 RecName: Full=Myocardin [Homo sapiens]ABN09234.1 myocardin splice variant A [Cloning vector pU.CAG.MyocS]AAN33040.1 myocardin transcription factor [Homo sapiens]EAW89971.1 myocardin, isoform CRA_b [Homo sapiens]KAI2581446.1 myocardin [Homo sapiens]KAI4047957.1 myocardin [Homo sapiens]|eukprot:NP_705832.1 myocardin isoform 2 [Homo sapiens]